MSSLAPVVSASSASISSTSMSSGSDQDLKLEDRFQELTYKLNQLLENKWKIVEKRSKTRVMRTQEQARKENEILAAINDEIKKVQSQIIKEKKIIKN